MTTYCLKRVYELAEDSDGYRVLVDRIWPRGVSKAKANLDAWEKDIAPSTELRKWFNHDPVRYSEFFERYCAELDSNARLKELVATDWSKCDRVTLLYSAHDEEHNQAVALKQYIESSGR